MQGRWQRLIICKAFPYLLCKGALAASYLKAIWTEAPKSYSLSFDSNGGSGSMGSITVTEGQSTRLPNNSFTREGYYFTGWNTRAAGGGTSYSDGAYATFYGNTILYAQWQKYADHVVSFYKNDGSGESRSQTIAYGQSGKLEANSFTREGYSFTGWNTKADGSGTSYGDGETVTPGGNMELYAQWNAESYTLSFDPNGGSGEMAAETVTYGVATRLPENSFTREKYSFTGWNTRADGSGTSYGDRETVSFTEDTVLYAQWELVPSYVAQRKSLKARGGRLQDDGRGRGLHRLCAQLHRGAGGHRRQRKNGGAGGSQFR